MAKKNEIKVRLDHLIPRESLRWVDPQEQDQHHLPMKRSPMTKLLYKDLADRGEMLPIFPLLRKPDFQRETSAWTPEDCVKLLESIVKSLIIPSLIVWKSPENSFLYILDSAHRISVMRAWIIDDWGDKAPENYYERHEFYDEIRQASQAVRDLVKGHIGSYNDFVAAGKKFLDASRLGSPREKLNDGEFRRGLFYTDMIQEAGFHIQEVSGDYEIAEASFLRINRSGQPLDDWETTLIENRNSSLARAVMSIANAGAGRYWPEHASISHLDTTLRFLTDESKELHQRIFVPPLKAPIHDANVPFIASSQYFPKHAYLLELLPIILATDDVDKLFIKDLDASPEAVIKNGRVLIERTALTFKHLTGGSNNPLSLSLVPLFYFYTGIGRYVRSSFYGFITWLMSGDDKDIRTRKTIFSAHRGRFEEIIFAYDAAGAITRRFGSGPRATDATVKFYQELLRLLITDSAPVNEQSIQSKLTEIMANLTTPSQRQKTNKSRGFTTSQKTKINLREIFNSAIRCEICGGVLDLRLGVQYDHITRFSDSGVTDVDQGRPTHPFCNNQRDAIEDYQSGEKALDLPLVDRIEDSGKDGYQMSLFQMFENTVFPDE